MDKINSQLPVEWMLCGFNFSLFATFEKTTTESLQHQVSFVPVELFNNETRIQVLFESGIPLDDFMKIKKPNHLMIIKLTGKFYSIDKMVFENLLVTDRSYLVKLKYIRIESFDGDPFESDQFLLIPINVFLNNFSISVDFEVYKKAFFNGKEEKTSQIKIPGFSIDFAGNNSSNNYDTHE